VGGGWASWVSRRRVAARKTGLGVEIGFIYCRLRWSTGESAPGIDAVISGRGFLPLLLPPLPAVARETVPLPPETGNRRKSEGDGLGRLGEEEEEEEEEEVRDLGDGILPPPCSPICVRSTQLTLTRARRYLLARMRHPRYRIRSG